MYCSQHAFRICRNFVFLALACRLAAAACASDLVVDGGAFSLYGNLSGANVFLNSGATLTGDGTIHADGTVSGGTVAPYGGVSSAGLIEFSGTLQFLPPATLKCRILGNSSIDRIKAGNAVSGNCTVLLTNARAFIPIDQILVDGGGSSDYSSFALASGIQTNWSLKVSGDDLLLTERWGDTDGDTLPDWWEMEYYADRVSAVTNAHDDADGMPNIDEYIAGTDPTNTASQFCFTQIAAPAADETVLTWLSAKGRLYTLEISTNLTDGFAPAESDIVSTYPQNIYTNVVGGTNMLHYRLRVRMDL